MKWPASVGTPVINQSRKPINKEIFPTKQVEQMHIAGTDYAMKG
jgi:hypothetical protein